jgi:hypothetical protein
LFSDRVFSGGITDYGMVEHHLAFRRRVMKVVRSSYNTSVSRLLKSQAIDSMQLKLSELLCCFFHILRYAISTNPIIIVSVLLLISTIGSHAEKRSDELFLPNLFGDEFRDVYLASEMASLSRAVYDIDPDTLNIAALSQQYIPIRFKDTGSTEVMVVTTEATNSSNPRIIVVFRGTDPSPDGGKSSWSHSLIPLNSFRTS